MFVEKPHQKAGGSLERVTNLSGIIHITSGMGESWNLKPDNPL